MAKNTRLYPRYTPYKWLDYIFVYKIYGDYNRLRDSTIQNPFLVEHKFYIFWIRDALEIFVNYNYPCN